MKILFVAAEVTPFAKVGGLGDVLGALPKALARCGHDVRIVMPLYRQVPRQGLMFHPHPLGVPTNFGEKWCAVAEGRLPDSEVPVYFLEHDDYYDRDGVYADHGDGHRRYGLLSRGSLQLCRWLGWTPDVIHCNDWQTAVIPAWLNSVEAGSELGRCASVLTIHNLAHQGRYGTGVLHELSIAPEFFTHRGFEHHGAVNLLKGGIYHATLITTVSPTYAHEIQTKRYGMELEGVLQDRSPDLYGVLNGIDDEVWNPAADPYLPARYSVDEPAGKATCKAALQAEMGLPQRPDVPLVGIVCRLVAQKGIDAIIEALPDLLSQDLQLVLLGRGDPNAERTFQRYAAMRPDRFTAVIDYNEPIAHRIEAGSDLFLMPSMFEPCGLNQMYSMRYGTLPVVRATGGLDDTVDNCHEHAGDGTGFKLWHLSGDSIARTVEWACSVYRGNPELFGAMRDRAMRKDFSWRRAAGQFESLYQHAIARRHGFA